MDVADHRLNEPMIDLTSLNGIESIFRGDDAYDPFAIDLVGDLANFIIYAKHVRFPLPVRPDREPEIPFILRRFVEVTGERNLFRPIEVPTTGPVALAGGDETLFAAFDAFYAWALANRTKLTQTVALHSKEWIRKGHDTRIKNDHTFEVAHLRRLQRFEQLQYELQTTSDMICYTFDVALRGSLYGRLVGADETYLAHPIRHAKLHPSSTETAIEAWEPCISFQREFSRRAAGRTLYIDDFFRDVYELRALVHDNGLHRLQQGAIGREEVRDIAAKAGLSARLAGISAAAAVASALLPLAESGRQLLVGQADSVRSFAAGVAAALVTVSAVVWEARGGGRLPQFTGRWQWIKRFVRYDVEDELDKSA